MRFLFFYKLYNFFISLLNMIIQMNTVSLSSNIKKKNCYLLYYVKKIVYIHYEIKTYEK